MDLRSYTTKISWGFYQFLYIFTSGLGWVVAGKLKEVGRDDYSFKNKIKHGSMGSGSGLPSDICFLVIFIAIRLSFLSIQKLVLYVGILCVVLI